MGYKIKLKKDGTIEGKIDGNTYAGSFFENETAVRNMLKDKGGKYSRSDKHASVHEDINDWLWRGYKK